MNRIVTGISIALFFAGVAFADQVEKSGSGRDRGPGVSHSTESHPTSPPVVGPHRMTDAELELNDREANDPDFVSDPNDPDSCAGGCETPDNLDPETGEPVE